MKPFAQQTDDELAASLQAARLALPDAPLAWQRAAIGLWPAAGLRAAGLAQRAAAALRVVAAVLSFDSWATPATALGMRSLRAPTRHLLFSAEGRDIDLRVTPEAGAFALTGQILGPDEAGSVALAREPDTSTGNTADNTAASAVPDRQVALDALGEFRIDGLARGTYRLTLALGDAQIVLPPLAVGEPPAAAGAPAVDPGR